MEYIERYKKRLAKRMTRHKELLNDSTQERFKDMHMRAVLSINAEQTALTNVKNKITGEWKKLQEDYKKILEEAGDNNTRCD